MDKVGCPSCGDSCEHEWVLISPENLRFTGKSALEVVRKEMNSRVPPAAQLENINDSFCYIFFRYTTLACLIQSKVCIPNRDAF
jgi:hypothetical protein